MKKIKTFFALVLCLIILISAITIPNMDFNVSAEDTTITLTEKDFEIKVLQDCTVDGNTVSSVPNKQYPRFYINLNKEYYVKTIKITAKATGTNYSTGAPTTISLAYSEDQSSLGKDVTNCGWNYSNWTPNSSSTKTANIGTDFQVKAINQIRSYGFWALQPTNDSQYTITIEKIEIIESNLLKAQEIGIENVTDASIDLKIDLNDGDLIDLRYSKQPINEENFTNASKSDVASDGSCKISNLESDTLYYLGAKISNGKKTGYFFTSATTYPTETSDSIILSKDVLSVESISNSSVVENTVFSATSKTATFSIILPKSYYITGFRITAKTENNSLYTIDAGMLLFDGDTKITECGFKNGFSEKYVDTRYFRVPEEAHFTAVNSIRFLAEWYDIPSNAGDFKFIIEKVEITGKEALIAPEMQFVNETGNSVDVSWESVVNSEYELWYSTEKLSSANFNSVTNKVLAYKGENTATIIQGLIERKDYYFILKTIRNNDIAYSTAKVIPLSLDSEWIIFTDSEINVSNGVKVSTQGNTLNGWKGNRWSVGFTINLPQAYKVKSVKITASVANNALIWNSGSITLKTADGITVGSVTRDGTNYFDSANTTADIVVAEANQSMEATKIVFSNANWISNPTDGSSTVTIEKIEINGECIISNPNIIFDKITGESVTVNWNLPKNLGVNLWYSESELTAENFDYVTKTKIASGRISSATVNGLTMGKLYYFALEVINGNENILFFSSIKPEGAVYDFEKSKKLTDYISIPRDYGLFYFINGYGKVVSPAIENSEKYSDFGNAFKMQCKERTSTIWPILYFYAPNWGDFAGEGFSMTIGKTKNHLGQDVAIAANVQITVDGYGVYETVEHWEGSTFSKDTSKKTVEFKYEDFFSDKDKTKKMTEEMSEHITNIRIFFEIPASQGAFSLYFDSIRVINPIDIVREVEEMSFANNIITLQEGGNTSQRPNFVPYNATENTLSWTTDTPDVISIDENTGNIVANKMGIANVIATAPNGTTASYKVVVKEDARGVVYRDLFCFDDGEMPDNVLYTNAIPKLEYVKIDKGGSLYLKSNGNLSTEFTVKDYDFYGEGLGIWACGNGGRYMGLELITTDGKKFDYSLMIDNEIGNYVNIGYSLFKNSSTGKSPSKSDIINFKKLKISYDNSLYIDSIKVKDPLVYNLKRSPENSLVNTNAQITDKNNVLGNYKYYLELLEIGSDYNWATNALINAELISHQSESQVYSLYFVDDDFVQHDLENYIMVTLDIPQALEGMNNIWVLYLDNNKIKGVTAHIVGNKITFEVSKSGIYCMIAGDGDKYLTKKIKSTEEVEIMTSPSIEPQIISKDITTIKRKKNSNTVQVPINSNNLILWIIIPIAVLVIAGGTITAIIIVKKHKKKGSETN